jgi:hypothetical protein
MHGSIVHYYVAAYGANGRPVAEKGSEGSPNILEISGTAPAGGGDDENPLASGGGSSSTSGGDVKSTVTVGPKKAKLMFAISGGTGFGYVTGMTEYGNAVKSCCIGNSLAVVMPELGYYINPRTSIGIVARLGFPIGANVDGHATMAPAGLVRVRYALSASGDGLHVMGQLGAGILRDTIKIDNPDMPMQDTDVVAQGPLLVGGGVGFTKHLSRSVSFLADASAIAAIAVTDHIGTFAPSLNSGIAADFSIGLAFGL